MPENCKQNQRYTFGMSMRYTFKNFGFINISPAINRMFFQSGTAKTYLSGRLYFNARYKKIMLEGNMGLPYYVYGERTESKSSADSEAYLSWNINKNWTVTVGSRYIFGQTTKEGWIYDTDYYSYSFGTSKDRNRILLFGFRYNLQNQSKPNRTQVKLYQEDQGIELIKSK
jgi:hypothetical protein